MLTFLNGDRPNTVRRSGMVQQQETPPQIVGVRIGQIIPDTIAGIVTGIISVLTTISLAAMVFSGDLAPFIAVGIGITLFSNIVIRTIVSLTSSFPGVISNPQAEQMALIAIIGASISAQMSNTSSSILLSTVLVAIALTSVLTGAFLLAIAPFNVSELIRYIPYPLIGGFLAGIGVLLVQGAFKLVMRRKGIPLMRHKYMPHIQG
ncbi:MAG: SulP family inorganic anion transporter [Elainellaceae cyanobacterium]